MKVSGRLWAIALLLGCGEPSGSEEAVPDAYATCAVGFSPADQAAGWDGDFFIGQLWLTTEGSGAVDVIRVEDHTGGVSDPSPAVGSFTLGGGYEACEVCITLSEGCSGGSCARTYLAEAGTFTTTAWGDVDGRWVGTLTELGLVEVTLNSAEHTAEVVADGECWYVREVAFDALVEDSANPPF